MTKTKSSKRALLMSALSLLMCVSMLIGSTFAWFTDSVTSSGNKIVAGTLDIQLLMDADVDGTYDDISDSTSPIFGEGSIAQNKNAETLWEPGKTQVAYLAIKNNGSLDLKYTVGLNVQNVSKDLYEVMEYAIVPNADANNKVTAWNGGNSVVVGTQSVAGDVTLANGETHYFALVIHMDEDAGNKYQGGEVNFDLTVLATQVASESDSFGNDYDKDAPRLVWDGTIDTSWYNADATTYELSSPAKLAGLAKLVNEGNTFAGKNIMLAADMDLANIAWTTIGVADHNFNGKFYGNGFKIYNLNVSGTKGVGLFGFAGNAAHIEGVHIVGANVTGENSVGAVLGYGYLAADCLKNCTVEDAVVYAAAGASKEDGDKVGAVAGWTSNGNIIGNKAINCEIYGCRDMGGIVGYANGENRALEISGNVVDKVTVNVVKTADYKKELGSNVNDIVGRTGSRVTVQSNSGKIEKIADVAAASNTEDLKAAVANGGEVTLVAGTYSFPESSFNEKTVLNCKPGTVFTGGTGLNINGATVVGAEFSNENGTAATSTINGVFKNCVFDGSNGLRWCYAGETVVFEDCIFSGDVYGVHFDGGANEVIFRRCTLSGFNALGGAITLATFEDCTFVSNGRSAYNGINMWGSTNMTGCKFVFDGTAAYEWIDLCGANKTASFTNCVVTDGTTEKGVEDYTSKREANSKIIVNGVQLITSGADLSNALANGGDVVMANDVTLTGKVITTNGITEAYGNKVGVAQYGGTLDGNGNTLTETGSSAYVIVTHGGTIKNLTIVGGGRGIVIYAPTEDVIIDNVVIDGPGYAINTAEHNGQDLIVTNSTVNGWTSLAGLDSVSFTNCKFGENSTKCWQNYGYDADYDRLIRPYGQTSFTDCTFEKNFYIDLSALANGNTVTLTNCNCEGVVLTAENYANYITVELPDWATSIADCIVFN